MTAIKLYLDEDITSGPALAANLRQRGFDVVSVVELGHGGWTDEEQFEYAISTGRALLTFNIKDFIPLAQNFYNNGQEFSGLIVSPQIKRAQFSLLLRSILNLLNQVDEASMRNTVRFLQEFH